MYLPAVICFEYKCKIGLRIIHQKLGFTMSSIADAQHKIFGFVTYLTENNEISPPFSSLILQDTSYRNINRNRVVNAFERTALTYRRCWIETSY